MDMIETIQEQLKGMFPGVLDMQFSEAAPERVTASMVVRPELCTVGDVLHGGAIMTFADTLGAVGTILNLSGGGTVTIESKTNFLGTAPVGSRIVGECTPLHRGRRTMVWQTRITSAEGKLLALVIQTQMVL